MRAGGRTVRGTHYMAQPNGSRLLDIWQLIEEERVCLYVTRNMALDVVAEVHRVLEHERIRGNLVLKVI